MTAYPKTQYIRSRKLLQAVASLPCMHCGAHGSTQAAHSNQSAHGKGRSIKAGDQFTAALCCACHHEVDQGHRLSKAERIELWTTAWRKTVRALVQRGEWPADVPVPDIRLFH
jgi:hypothetical protein